MKKRSVALVSLTLAVTLGASIAVAAATARVPALPQNAAVTQHAHITDSSTTGNSGPASGTHPMNHGFFVSQAAHTCIHGARAVHGMCVRALAQSSKGKN